MEELGPKVTKSWKKGDRIAAFVHESKIFVYSALMGNNASIMVALAVEFRGFRPLV